MTAYVGDHLGFLKEVELSSGSVYRKTLVQGIVTHILKVHDRDDLIVVARIGGVVEFYFLGSSNSFTSLHRLSLDVDIKGLGSCPVQKIILITTSDGMIHRFFLDDLEADTTVGLKNVNVCDHIELCTFRYPQPSHIPRDGLLCFAAIYVRELGNPAVYKVFLTDGNLTVSQCWSGRNVQATILSLEVVFMTRSTVWLSDLDLLSGSMDGVLRFYRPSVHKKPILEFSLDAITQISSQDTGQTTNKLRPISCLHVIHPSLFVLGDTMGVVIACKVDFSSQMIDHATEKDELLSSIHSANPPKRTRIYKERKDLWLGDPQANGRMLTLELNHGRKSHLDYCRKVIEVLGSYKGVVGTVTDIKTTGFCMNTTTVTRLRALPPNAQLFVSSLGRRLYIFNLANRKLLKSIYLKQMIHKVLPVSRNSEFHHKKEDSKVLHSGGLDDPQYVDDSSETYDSDNQDESITE